MMVKSRALEKELVQCNLTELMKKKKRPQREELSTSWSTGSRKKLSNTNDSSMYAITTKEQNQFRILFSLVHCRLGTTLEMKRIEKLQHDGLLNSIDIGSLGKCVSCLSGKMARKPYSHQVERAKDLLGLIHTDIPKETLDNLSTAPSENKVVCCSDASSLSPKLLDLKVKVGVWGRSEEIQEEDTNPSRVLDYEDMANDVKTAFPQWTSPPKKSNMDHPEGFCESKIQPYAEYMAAFDASKEAVWIRKFISVLGIVPTIEEPISMIEKIDTDDNLLNPSQGFGQFPKHSN
ncbi:hypothetical protein Tco_0361222 [Tanacetum coccineum]